MNFRCKFTNRRSIRRPRFPVRMQNFSDLATFSVDFCILYSECPPYFYFPVFWPTDLEIIPHASTPTSIIPTKFEVDMIMYTLLCYSVFVCWYVTWLCDLDFWPFDLEQLLCMAGHMPNLATKFEDPTPLSSWFMSHNVSRLLPFWMRTRPLRMHRITCPVSMGSKANTFLESPTLICLFANRGRAY